MASENGSGAANVETKKGGGITVQDFDDVTVEASGPHNYNPLFWPLGEVLRGRWSIHNMPPGSMSEQGMNQMPDLPGLCIELNPRKRIMRVYDPLELDENKQVLAQARKVHKEVFNTTPEPNPQKKFVDVSDDLLATWYYHIWRNVEEGYMRVIKGELPTLEEIRMLPNQIQVDFIGSYSDGKVTKAASEL